MAELLLVNPATISTQLFKWLWSFYHTFQAEIFCYHFVIVFGRQALRRQCGRASSNLLAFGATWADNYARNILDHLLITLHQNKTYNNILVMTTKSTANQSQEPLFPSPHYN